MLPTPRHVRLAALTALVALAAFAVPALAAERNAPTASGSAKEPPPAAAMPALPENAEEIEALKGQPVPAPAVVRRPVGKTTPMMAEILGYLEARDQAMTLKRQQLKSAATDAAAALALQAELQGMKQETELEVLRIQSRWARKEGRTADADKLDAVIAEILNPRVPIATEKRPVPATPTAPASR
jgi:hypothetical protein